MTRRELEEIGIKRLGRDVMVSTLARIYNPELVDLGDRSRIDDFCVLTGRIELGHDVHIALFTHIGGTREGVFMDDYSECAYHCSIVTHSSDYQLATLHSPSVPPELKGGESGPVRIGRHALLGAYSLVMPGIVIGEGCSFSAYSFVNQDTAPWGRYAGHPIRLIGENSRECLDLAAKHEALRLSQGE